MTSVSASSVGVNWSGNSSPFNLMPTPDNKLRVFTKGRDSSSGGGNGGRTGKRPSFIGGGVDVFGSKCTEITGT